MLFQSKELERQETPETPERPETVETFKTKQFSPALQGNLVLRITVRKLTNRARELFWGFVPIFSIIGFL